VTIEPSFPDRIVERIGSSRWVLRARALLAAVFLLVLSPWLISYWLLKWNLTDLLLIDADWYEFPPIRPLINDLANFEEWGFWTLAVILLSMVGLTWIRARWKTWAFLHPIEVRFYPDGSTVALSEEVVAPNRALRYVLDHTLALSVLVAAGAALWFFAAPYTQLPSNLVNFDPTQVLAFFPWFLILTWSGWNSFLYAAGVVVVGQIRTLELHRIAILELERKYGGRSAR